MRRLSALLGLFIFAATAACTQAEAPVGTASDALVTSARNEDVQVLKVTNAPSFSISKGSIYKMIDQEQCKPEGKSWSEIKAWDVETSGYLPVRLDCTEAFAKLYGYPSIRTVSLLGSRTKKSEEGYYGYVGFSSGAGSYWVKTIELVVKEPTIASESFHGIGFYLNEFSYRYYEARPAPGPNNGNGYFLFADQVRAQANQYPAATLPSGDKVRVIKVLLPSAYALGGSSAVTAYYFRPFAEYVAGEDKHQRWDSVLTDYFVGGSTEFNREADVLAH